MTSDDDHMDPLKRSPKLKYAPSKWETVDPSIIEAQGKKFWWPKLSSCMRHLSFKCRRSWNVCVTAMTTSKWDLLDQQDDDDDDDDHLNKGDDDEDDDDIDGRSVSLTCAAEKNSNTEVLWFFLPTAKVVLCRPMEDDDSSFALDSKYIDSDSRDRDIYDHRERNDADFYKMTEERRAKLREIEVSRGSGLLCHSAR